MKVFIAGANGRVSQELIKDLVAKGHEIFAGLRNAERLEATSQVTPVEMDLTASVEELTSLLTGMDAVYFTAGSRGQDLLRVDAFGAVKMMQAAERAGIKRFILLSSVFADKPENWHFDSLKGIENYNIAKFFADHWLMSQTSLDYTILQPGNLVEEEGRGQITVNVSQPAANAISDVAMTLAEILENKNTIKRVITMSNGQTPIKVALDSL